MTLFIYYLVMALMVGITYKLNIYNREDSHLAKSDYKYLLAVSLPIAIYSLFWGLRYDVGIDHLAYLTRYAAGIIDDRLEVGYLALEKLLHALDMPYPVLFITTSIVNICSVYILAKGRDKRFLCLLVLFFWTSETIYFAQNGIRQMFAISLVFFALHNLCKRKYIIAALFFISAFYFHTSSILFSSFVIILWLYVHSNKISINKYIILVLFLSVEIYGQIFTIPDIPFLNIIVSSLGYEHHFDKLESWEFDIVEGSGVGAIARMIIFSIIILSQNKLLEDNDILKRVFYWLFVFGAILHPILNPNLILNRLCAYFGATYFVTFAFFACELWYGNMSKINKSKLLLILFIIYNLAIMSKNCATNGCKEYQTIFSSTNTTVIL